MIILVFSFIICYSNTVGAADTLESLSGDRQVLWESAEGVKREPPKKWMGNVYLSGKRTGQMFDSLEG